MRNLLLTLLLFAGTPLSTPLLAQQSRLSVQPPSSHYESEVSSDWDILGRYIVDDYPTITVYLDYADVTTQVSWSWTAERRVDVNRDGILEAFSATLVLDTSSQVLDDGSYLNVEVSATGVGGVNPKGHAGLGVLGHAAIGGAPTLHDASAPPQDLLALVTLRKLPTNATHTITVKKDGLDVTLTTIINDVLIGTSPYPNDPEVDQYRDVYVDCASLGALTSSTVVEIGVTVSWPGSSFGSTSTFTFGGTPDEVPFEDEKICDLINALGVTQASSSSPVQMSQTDKDAMRAALGALKQAIRDCQSGEEQGQPYTVTGAVDCGGGNVVNININIGGNGTSTNPHGGNASAGSMASENTLVIAIGGCAANGSGSASGGPAGARGGNGTVAIALGGTGGDGGTGGRGSAVMPGNGQGHGLGGTGGSGGGAGGSGWSDTYGGDGPGNGGSGQAAGGPGGHNGDGSTGGNGGGAGVRTTTGGMCEQPGGPTGGGAGGEDLHGSGACASADSSGAASCSPGHSVDND